jgi:pimeloyl-ACP methyl ester carboxylesterase
VRQALFGLAGVVVLLAGLALVAARHDQLPATPGSWLASSGLEARHETIGGHRLRFVRAGSGDPVVLVHGFASSLYTWKDVLPALATTHDVVALDLPGFGGSDRPFDLRFEELPAAVLGLMDRLGLERVALVGNSMGGGVVALVAAERPRRVSALVLIDAAGFDLEPEDQPGMVRLMTSPLGALAGGLPGRRLAVEAALRQVFHDDRLVTDERVTEYMAGLSRPGTFAAMRSLGLSLADRTGVVEEGLSRIAAPTLVVWGREDRWIPLADAERFVDAIPNAEKAVFDACGHMPQEEKPGMLTDLVRNFLARASLAGGESTSSRG